MRISSAAIFTLATLATGNVTQQATAAPANNSTQNQKTANVVIPVTEVTPAQVNTIASPETVVVSQFSQNKDTAKEVTDSNLIVTATDVQIVGATPELQQIVSKIIKTQVGGETSQTQLQKDVAAILDTGLFANASVNSSSTKAGFNVVYQVQPVVVRSLQFSGAKALNYQQALKPFQSQIGKPISPANLQQAVQQINQWYADSGYKVARVLSITPSREGILTVDVAEGLVGDIKFRFVNDQGQTVDEQGKPIAGRTKTDFLRQQIKLKPGELFQENLVKQDLQNLYKLGLFDSVNVALEGDANKLDVIYQLQERGARSVNVGGNYNADQGLVGSLSFQDQNVGGVNNSFGANLQIGARDLQFNTKFTNPYRSNNPDALGYSVGAFRNRELSNTFDDEIKLANGDKVREGQFGGSLTFQRPIEGWDTSLGFNYSRTSIRDSDGKITPVDAQGNPLSFSGTGIDDLTTVSFTAVKDNRDNPANPTQGSVLGLKTEQSIPIGQGEISMNRLEANYSQFVPIKLFDSQQPQVFAVNLQAGTVIGDLPPYQTFNLGGPNSVRGYDSGQLGSGRSYVLLQQNTAFLCGKISVALCLVTSLLIWVLVTLYLATRRECVVNQVLVLVMGQVYALIHP